MKKNQKNLLFFKDILNFAGALLQRITVPKQDTCIPVLRVRRMVSQIELREHIREHGKIVKKLQGKGYKHLTSEELDILRSIDYAKNKIRIMS